MVTAKQTPCTRPACRQKRRCSLCAPLAGERLGWPHLAGALLGFAGVALLAISRGISFSSVYALGYALALGCAFAWSLYSVLSRRLGETPTDAIASFCAAAAVLS